MFADVTLRLRVVRYERLRSKQHRAIVPSSFITRAHRCACGTGRFQTINNTKTNRLKRVWSMLIHNTQYFPSPLPQSTATLQRPWKIVFDRKPTVSTTQRLRFSVARNTGVFIASSHTKHRKRGLNNGGENQICSFLRVIRMFPSQTIDFDSRVLDIFE